MSATPPELPAEPPSAATSETPGHRPLLAERPPSAILFSSAPILFAFLLLAAAGTLFLLARMGGTAEGERLSLVWTAPCAAEALPLVQARAEAIGLGAPELEAEGGALRLVATMPGHDDDRTAMPAVLGGRGQLAVLHGGETVLTEADVVAAQLRLDESGMPYTHLDLAEGPGDALAERTAADPEGELVITMDGAELVRRPNIDPVKGRKLRIVAEDGVTRDRMRQAVDRALLLQHGPLPCDLGEARVSGAGGATTAP